MFHPRILLTLTLLTAALFAQAVLAQDTPVGAVASLEGEADVTRGEEVTPLTVGDEVFRTDVIRTKTGTRLAVELDDGSQFTMDENSKVTLSQYVTGEEANGLLDMARGRIRASVSKTFSRRRDAFKIRTRNAVMGVQGTDFLVEAGVRATRVFVYEGTVSVTSLDTPAPQVEILGAGQTTEVRAGEPPAPPREFAPPAAAEAQASSQPGPDLGSGSDQDIMSSGLQAADPTTETPTVEEPVMDDPLPNPPDDGDDG